jgi:hypothetical protein
MFFSFCYAFCLAFSDAHDGVIAHAVASRDAINTSVWLGEFSHDSAVSFGARPEQDFAGVATLVALRDEPLILRQAVIRLDHVQANRYGRLEQNAILVVTIIEIRPFRNGWEVYEAPGVQSVFLSQEQAYAFFTIIRCMATAPVANRFP